MIDCFHVVQSASMSLLAQKLPLDELDFQTPA
jgi:hypothetical protein